MQLSRRELMIVVGGALQGSLLAQPQGSSSTKAGAAWYNRLQRCAQHNLNEHDPASLDIEEWAEYWGSLKLEAIVLTGGGFIAFYPSKLPLHYKSQFLDDRSDFFEQYVAALRKRGMRVVARVETNWLHKQIADKRPDWLERKSNGEPAAHNETPWVYHTCMFSDYHKTQVPAVINEILSNYDVDGIFTNSWPPSGTPRACHCRACVDTAGLPMKEKYQREQGRIVELCTMLNDLITGKGTGKVYNINYGGGVDAKMSLKKLGDIGSWLTADHQGRGGHTPVWDCAQQGRVAYAANKGGTVTNVVGTKSGFWRHSSRSAPEQKMWLAQCTATGMAPWYVWLGGELPDRRWRETGREFYQWMAENEAHLDGKEWLLNLGFVWTQRANTFYDAPGPIQNGYGSRGGYTPRPGDPIDHVQGAYYSLLEGRFPFNFVHEDDLGMETLSKYSALVLPNVALLSDKQCDQIRQYVSGGGSLIATFETSLYDEWGEPRKDFGLRDVFGITLANSKERRVGKVFYTTIEGKHEILSGFEDTTRLPGGEYRIPIKAAGHHLLTVVPPYPRGIPEMVYPYARTELDYPDSPHSNEPAMVLREENGSRLVYFSGDICRSVWRSGSEDCSKLFQNAVRWALRGKVPISVQGAGMLEVVGWRTQPGYAIHLINYNNPSMTKPDRRQNFPLGPQVVRVEVDAGVKVTRVKLLSGREDIRFNQSGQIVDFVIPQVIDYEVAALYAA